MRGRNKDGHLVEMLIGYVDGIGVLRCVPCAELSDVDHAQESEIWSRNSAHNSECCDQCDRPIARILLP